MKIIYRAIFFLKYFLCQKQCCIKDRMFECLFCTDSTVQLHTMYLPYIDDGSPLRIF